MVYIDIDGIYRWYMDCSSTFGIAGRSPFPNWLIATVRVQFRRVFGLSSSFGVGILSRQYRFSLNVGILNN